MAIPNSSLQKVNPSAIIELFQLQLIEGIHYATGNAPSSSDNGKYYFHSGTSLKTNNGLVPFVGLPLCIQELFTASQYAPVSAS